MEIQSLQLGQSHANLEKLASANLTKHSSKQYVMTANALELISENQRLAPGSFERFRAKTIGIGIGGVLPIAITGIFSLVIYGLYQNGTLAIIYQKTQAAVSALATKAFAAMTANSATIAASSGGALAAAFALTRPGVYEAIGSFFGSLFGSFTGTGLYQFVRETQSVGYNWWYNKYRFTEREQAIQSNKGTVIMLLADAYNDMAADLKETLNKEKENAKAVEKLKDTASMLKKRLPIIHEIFERQGIQNNKCEEITLQLEKAIGTVLGAAAPKVAKR